MGDKFLPEKIFVYKTVRRQKIIDAKYLHDVFLKTFDSKLKRKEKGFGRKKIW